MTESINEISYRRTSTVKEKISYVWCIDNVSKLKKKTDFNLISPVFPTDSSQSSQWIIVFFPNRSENNFYINFLYLYAREVRVELKYFVLDDDNQILFNTNFSPKIFNEEKCKPTCDFLVDFQNGYKSYIKEDKLKIQVVINTEFVREDTSCPEITDNPLSKLSSDLESLYINKEFSDFKIKVNGFEKPVHKSVLGARSKVFSAMFQHDFVENNKNCLEISDMDESAVSQLLQFIYSGKIKFASESDAINLFIAANKYEILDLKELCESFLIKTVSTSNVLDLLILADRHDGIHLQNEAMDYFVQHKDQFHQEDAFQNVLKEAPYLFPKLMAKILNN